MKIAVFTIAVSIGITSPLLCNTFAKTILETNIIWWIADFKERYCQKPFEHALVIMCGNGWVERGLYDKGIAKQFSSFDYLEDLLQKAEQMKEDRPIHYFQADANKIELEENKYDLIVNVAAMHHVQYINRMCKTLCHALKPGGVFVNTDYIGPHRNQYSLRHWNHVKTINTQLPQQYRKQPLNKPHLGTMLHTDSSEAIHSELTFDSIARYFHATLILSSVMIPMVVLLILCSLIIETFQKI